jgi:hypothetical protein
MMMICEGNAKRYWVPAGKQAMSYLVRDGESAVYVSILFQRTVMGTGKETAVNSWGRKEGRGANQNIKHVGLRAKDQKKRKNTYTALQSSGSSSDKIVLEC